MNFYRRLIVALLVALATPAWADDDPLRACDLAAVQAEADWQLPAGLLSAIATVESGRGGLGSVRPVAWPWTINAGGVGLYKPDKDVALMTVRTLQRAGFRAIDVGCFQVDLFYHPDAFASLDVAFDPAANAAAAARILTDGRRGGSWEIAIALYHSASVISGARYLRQVQAAWPSARLRAAAVAAAPDPYATLVAPADLPRLLGPRDSASVLQWTAEPPQNLPVVLLPAPRPPH
jgi:hypothetical protein